MGDQASSLPTAMLGSSTSVCNVPWSILSAVGGAEGTDEQGKAFITARAQHTQQAGHGDLSAPEGCVLAASPATSNGSHRCDVQAILGGDCIGHAGLFMPTPSV